MMKQREKSNRNIWKIILAASCLSGIMLLPGQLFLGTTVKAEIVGEDEYQYEIYTELSNDDEVELEEGEEFGVRSKKYKNFSYSRCVQGAIVTGYRGKKKQVVIPSAINGLPVKGVDFRGMKNKIESLHIPASVTEEIWIGGNDKLKKITIDKKNPAFQIKNNLILSKDGKTLHCVPARLTKVTIPDTVEEFDVYSFDYSNVKEVVFSKNLTDMGFYTFSECPKLEKIVVNDKISEMDSIGSVPSLKTVILPKGVKKIDSGAFSGCEGIKDIYIYNEDCIIKNEYASFSSTLIKSATIHGYKGSTAEAYAKKYGQKFVAFSKKAPSKNMVRSAKKGELAIDKKQFPDVKLRDYLKKEYDINKDRILSVEEQKKVKTIKLECEEDDLNLKGISSLTEVKKLIIKDSSELSNEIQISNTKEISKLAKLEVLEIVTKGTFESCYFNMPGFTIKKNKKLKKLVLDGVQLNKVDVSANKALEEIDLRGNMRKLDVTANKKLKVLKCSSEYMRRLPQGMSEKTIEILHLYIPIKTLNVSKFTKLKELVCHSYGLKELKLGNSLEKLICYWTKIDKLDVSGNKELRYLDCNGCKLTSLDVSKNTKLKSLICNSNKIKELDVSNCPNLEYLDVYSNELTTLSLNKNRNLKTLICYSNLVTSLDVSKLTKLEYLDCSYNEIISLDVTKNKRLKELSCYQTKLTSLNVSRNQQLAYLCCYGNQLKKLDVTKNRKLKELYCQSNQLTGLNVLKNKKLERLSCYNNNIKELSTKGLNKILCVCMDTYVTYRR